MAVRSLQIRAKFITFIEIKAPRCRGVRSKKHHFLSFATEHTHIVRRCKDFLAAHIDGAQVWQTLDFRAVAFGGG